jgi:hypothetical protein
MEVREMINDNRDILEILKGELDFLQSGGYSRSVRTPWQPKSAFQESLTCINYGYPYRVHPCNECPLLDFVDLDHQLESIPCHYIPLNKSGETIDSLELDDDEERLQRKLENWLHARIHDIEEKRSELAMAGCP